MLKISTVSYQEKSMDNYNNNGYDNGYNNNDNRNNNRNNNNNNNNNILTAHTSLYFQVYKQRLQILDFIGKSDNIEKNINENIAICLRMQLTRR